MNAQVQTVNENDGRHRAQERAPHYGPRLHNDPRYLNPDKSEGRHRA